VTVAKKKELIDKKLTKDSTVSITHLCEALDLSRNGWYHVPDSEKKEEDQKIKTLIEAIQSEFPYYGYKRVTEQMKRSDIQINHKRVYRIMGEYYLLQPRKRKGKPKTTNSKHNYVVYTNEIKHLGTVIPGSVWVSDITYVWCGNRWGYVAIVMDQAMKKVVGWSMATSMDRQLCIEALNMALESHDAPLYHHSDRGVQYCSHDYIKILKENNITPSMADIGKSVDNPYAESFNRSLKVEEVYFNAYESFAEAKESIASYIMCYNTKRLHSSLGYMTPCEYEANYKLTVSKSL
jgi:putative transposase